MTRNVQEVLGVGEKLDRECATVILSALCFPHYIYIIFSAMLDLFRYHSVDWL
jgi:hypothetical protein